MKALTICQPYAALIVIGEKLVENREWPTNYRGRLLIHAGKSRQWLDDEDEQAFAGRDPLVFGSVVGEARLADVLHIDRIRRGEYDAKYPWLREHTHTHGTWCWVLQDVTRYEQPVPWKGAQGLWNFPDAALTHNGASAGPQVGHLERLHARIEAMRPLDKTALLMPFEQKVALVTEHGWTNRGEWNNWFRPGCGWNYALHDAVVCILSETPNAPELTRVELLGTDDGNDDGSKTAQAAGRAGIPDGNIKPEY